MRNGAVAMGAGLLRTIARMAGQAAGSLGDRADDVGVIDALLARRAQGVDLQFGCQPIVQLTARFEVALLRPEIRHLGDLLLPALRLTGRHPDCRKCFGRGSGLPAGSARRWCRTWPLDAPTSPFRTRLPLSRKSHSCTRSSAERTALVADRMALWAARNGSRSADL